MEYICILLLSETLQSQFELIGWHCIYRPASPLHTNRPSLSLFLVLDHMHKMSCHSNKATNKLKVKVTFLPGLL